MSAYAVCARDDEVLLARWTSPRGPEWTLPGGGLDHGEDPADAAVREVREETGYAVRLDRLLIVRSFHMVLPDGPVDFHGIQILYSGTVIGGVIVAPKASELIMPVALAVEHRLTVDQLARAMSVYPSLSSSITDAARAMHIVN